MGKAQDHFDDINQIRDIEFSQKSYMDVSSGYYAPPTDVFETDDAIMIFVEIPGMVKENIELTIERGVIIVSGYRAHVCPSCVRRIHRMEIANGNFLRRIKLDVSINRKEIEAEYHNGMLEITVPKRDDNG